ncbi:methyltransferase-like protein 17, mitochondrial [Toxorhynchites rutilus septentrionalis]|uniref:methyltransferase-like protein 17, mitochondrial n=1 Tax=Toxorhynchites rutilus septentrionalis TaxID=329112 RepID=UPI00247AC085|nr:methyltransferase-like protein 17, mitochondrial [Toxorhynchites rutilus septentrionalis]
MATLGALMRKNLAYHQFRRSFCVATKCRPEVTLEESTQHAVETGKYKPRQHEGRLVSGCVSVPEQIVNAILKCCKDYPLKALLAEGVKLNNFVRSRKVPLETDEIRRKIIDLRHSVAEDIRGKIDVEKMDEEQLTRVNQAVETQSKKRVKQHIYAWKPLNYDEYKALQYLLGRSAAEYSVLNRIFDEIKIRDPEFKPRSFIDFGSGVGTGTWAAANVWKESIFEYVSVDASASMNDLAELVLRGGDMNKAMTLRNVFYRQFLSASNTKHSIVLCAFSLFELPSRKIRLETIENLWNKCDGYLILVEHGSQAGFSLIEEARKFLLAKIESSGNEGHIFSPCPHHQQCPRMALQDGTPCNFESTFNPLPLSKGVEANKALYSYIVFHKGSPTQQTRYPRLVRQTLVRSKHSICRMCTEDGRLQEIIFTAAKHGKILYRCARASKWGDQLPIKIDLKAVDTVSECTGNVS